MVSSPAPRAAHLVAVWLGAVSLGSACIPAEVDVAGRPCPCPTEYRCDEASSTCVADGTVGGSGSGAGSPGAGASGPSVGGGGAGAEGAGAAGGGASCEGGCDAPGCPACPEIPMVNAFDFQIDATEVRVKDYLAFLDAAVPLATQPDVCSWNVSFHPHDSSSPFGCTDFDLTQPNRPIGCVDWCDAAAFCAWRGKRLCGKRGGGTLMLSDANDAQRSEWFAACSDDGTKAFPYGAVEDVNACNTAGGVSSGGVTADAGYYDECEGGVLGLFDMVGNAEEWEGSCDNFGGPAEHSCALRGGAFWSDASDWGTCATSGRTADRGTASHDWGFRCCGDLP